jgi:hypothetical protein
VKVALNLQENEIFVSDEIKLKANDETTYPCFTSFRR